MSVYTMKIWLLLVVASVALADKLQTDIDSNLPCKYTQDEGKVECKRITNKDTLYEELQRFRGYSINNLKLKSLHVPYLPAGLSLGLSIKRIYIEDSFVGNLYSPENATPSPFEGLEDSLEEVHILNTHEPSKWMWPDVKKFKKLRKISVSHSPMEFVGHTFAEIGEGSLTSIAVRHSKVYRLHPQAFPELTDLVHADFEGNYLPYLVRTMFPNPAPKLEILNFRDNRLFTLNENMFENMPALIFLDISRNEFKKFESTPFSPLWNQLQFFFLSENPFECGCSLVPLKQRLLEGSLPRSHDVKDVKCTSHGDFRKKKLSELDTDSLQCY